MMRLCIYTHTVTHPDTDYGCGIWKRNTNVKANRNGNGNVNNIYYHTTMFVCMSVCVTHHTCLHANPLHTDF